MLKIVSDLIKIYKKKFSVAKKILNFFLIGKNIITHNVCMYVDTYKFIFDMRKSYYY